ncbi:MAG: hypothetical protein ABIK89_07565, partial [Planctomycetota bacterium]
DIFIVLLYKLVHGILALVVKRRTLVNKLLILPNREDTFFLWLRPSAARPRWDALHNWTGDWWLGQSDGKLRDGTPPRGGIGFGNHRSHTFGDAPVARAMDGNV